MRDINGNEVGNNQPIYVKLSSYLELERFYVTCKALDIATPLTFEGFPFYYRINLEDKTCMINSYDHVIMYPKVSLDEFVHDNRGRVSAKKFGQ